MGLDVYVMPLSVYFERAFQSPLEQALDAATPNVRNPSDECTNSAGERVRKLQEELSSKTNSSICWSDEGKCAVSLQFYYAAVHAIRAFAAYQDSPMSEPGRSPQDGFTLKDPPKRWPPWPQLAGGRPNWTDPDFHPSLLHIYGGGTTRYPHLIRHNDNCGFYVPCDFREPIKFIESFPLEKSSIDPTSEEEDTQSKDAMAFFLSLISGSGEETIRAELDKGKGWENLNRSWAEKDRRSASVRDWGNVGSSLALFRELDELGKLLSMKKDWGELAEGESPSANNDPLGLVKYGWSVMRYVARISVEKALPIIFDG